ncbi:hypothetical protein FOB63_002347 [Clavispora lusitaniae]|uniref:Uncharacterized protein n=1 Tax=Clavispora lusitaniae (strain ATCC 42720) TaxID=306902 RepID=C4Y6V7_CLAL4|nr:uncharacterized protein CLUG_03891 [Clavispora lusitaniae ATCC 42720]EEQ39763.1 hypothetical protein CLUG_03891 [Clavispora lusitaniae ATCC 42720]KAF7582266.1 hypothetical protein FOB63_002347 [Clavispora lusitaniae]
MHHTQSQHLVFAFTLSAFIFQHMSGTIVRALGWDDGYTQRFLAINPLGDEVNLYQTAGEHDITKVHSYSGIDHIQCMSYSRRHVGWTGVGTLDGSVHVFDMAGGGGSVRLHVRQSRPCNAVTFNDGTLVAASFDKSRHDSSLQVWDMARHARVFGADSDGGGRAAHGFLANEATVSAAFDRADPGGMLLMAGGYKSLREYDMRDPGGAPVFQVATRCTSGLAFDHFSPHVFSSVAEDGSVAIWDRRRLTSGGHAAPALHFAKLVAASVRRGHAPCMRHSTVRRGEFAAVFNGNLIRRWNTGCVPKMDEASAPTFLPPASSLSTSSASVVASLKAQAAEMYAPSEESMFVALVLDCKTEWPRVASFDYSPDTTSRTSTSFVCLREKGSVFRMPVVESIEALDFDPHNGFALAGPEGTHSHTVPPLPQSSTSPHSPRSSRSRLSTPDSSGVRAHSPASSHSSSPPAAPLRHMWALDDVLRSDVCSAARARAEADYGADCDANAVVVATDEAAGASSSLRHTWQWLSLAKRSLDKGTMVRDGVDLGYVGVLAVWEGAEELQGQTRDAHGGTVEEARFASAVRAIVAAKGDKSAGISVSETAHRAQRQLCLLVCGWYLAANELDAQIDQLARDGHVEKAAAWAVFHGDVARAIDILAHAKHEQLQVISTAVAGYLAYKDSRVNSPWNDQCRKLASDLDHPYLRAIFAFIADNDWWDVLDEHALPLRERLGIAIRFLSDKDLHVYLHRVADTVVARGELEGLILTGLTPRGVDLLQSYVDRTSDVQTAALMAAHAVPRYFRDSRVDHWTDCYRSLLNSWGMFRTRARFDVARTRLARTSWGSPALRPPPRSVYLQCQRCNKNMFSGKAPKARAPMHKQLARLSLKGTDLPVTSCPHCGASLPRCAICLLTLGTSVPGVVRDSDAAGDTGASHFGNKFSFCLTCNHGYHAHHAEEWFSKHYVCPVPDCNCRCNSK